MDRRKKDKGVDARIPDYIKFMQAVRDSKVPEYPLRSGKDRRQKDLLSEASDYMTMVGRPEIDHTPEKQAIRLIIKVMERRK